MADYLIDFVTRTAQDDWEAWVAALQPEADNLRTALTWAIDSRETRIALRLMAALWPYWYRTNQFQRARDLAEKVLALPDPPDRTREDQILRSQLMNDAGNYAYNMADLEVAERLHRAALEVRVELGERGLMAGSWNNIGLVLRERGDYEGARRLTLDALHANDETRHAKWRLWTGMNHNNLGLISARVGDHAQAVDEQERASEVFQSLGNHWGVAMAQVDLADSLIELDDVGSAQEIFDRLLPTRWSERDDKRVASILRGKAAVEHRAGRADVACRYLLAALDLSAPLSDRLGEASALERLVPAAAACGRPALAAKADGALRAYGVLTGAVTASVVTARLSAARDRARQEASPQVYDRACAAAYDVASRGLVNLLVALDEPRPRPDDVVREASARTGAS